MSAARPAFAALCYSVIRSLLVLAILLPVATVYGQDAKSSLRESYNEARELPDTPEGRAAAIEKYRELIEIHKANEAVYQDALEQLVKAYLASDQVDQGIRYVVETANKMRQAERGHVLQKIVQELQLKHPEALKRVLGEMGLGSSRTAIPQPVAREDLADAILQRSDPDLRDKALGKLKGMLAADAPNEVAMQGLVTLGRALPAKFDRTEFLVLVRPLLSSDHAQVRKLAVGVLPGVGATEADLDAIIAMVADESAEVRAAVGGALIQIGQGEYGERVIPALLKILDDSEYRVVEQTLRSMWGQYASPELNARLIELSHHPQHHGHAIYHALSTQRSKSKPVCQRLVEELADPDWNNSGRAAWGLTYGVVDDARSVVEDGLLKALPQETNAYTRKQEFRALRGVATEKSRDYLQSVVDSKLETDESKDAARQILADLDAAS